MADNLPTIHDFPVPLLYQHFRSKVNEVYVLSFEKHGRYKSSASSFRKDGLDLEFWPWRQTCLEPELRRILVGLWSPASGGTIHAR